MSDAWAQNADASQEMVRATISSPPADEAAPVRALAGQWQLSAPPADEPGAATLAVPLGAETDRVAMARAAAAQAAVMVARAPSFEQLDPTVGRALLHDLESIQQALSREDATGSAFGAPFAQAQETPNDLMRRRMAARQPAPEPQPAQPAPAPQPGANPQVAATETIAGRTGALVDEIDFPAFVAGLVHGTFDAIVDATIRQMETFAELVSAVAKDVDAFTRENVTSNQVRDWLAERYPNELERDWSSARSSTPRLRRRRTRADNQEEEAPPWLSDFGLEGADLDDETIESQLVPAARRVVGEQRLQMLATMVLLGLNRVIIRDGTISARVRFRAAARDSARVTYQTGEDPSARNSWGSRGSAASAQHATMVSTVGVNVQADSQLEASLFGEVKINFASETLPLDRFVDAARLAMLQRNARTGHGGEPRQPAAPAAPAPAQLPAPPVTPAPAPAVPPAVAPASGPPKPA